LLQTNKKWSALKQRQREWIHELARDEHAAYVKENERLPMKKHKDEIISRVYARIEERGVWIPYGEFHRHVAAAIDRRNRKSPLFTPPAKKAKPPREGIEGFPENAQNEIKEKLAAGIRRYIEQTHKVPPDKVRDGELKNILRGFNTKQWKVHGKQLQISDALLALYDGMRKDISADMLPDTAAIVKHPAE